MSDESPAPTKDQTQPGTADTTGEAVHAAGAADVSQATRTELPESIRRRLKAAPSSAQRLGRVRRLARTRVGLPVRLRGNATLQAGMVRVAAASRGIARLAREAIPQSSDLKAALPRAAALGQRAVSGAKETGLVIGTQIDRLVKNISDAGAKKTSAVKPFEAADPRTARRQVTQREGLPPIFGLGHIAIALVTGGLIHLATTFAVPHLATNSAYSYLQHALPANRMVVMPTQIAGRQILPELPTDYLYAMCRFDVRSDPVVIRARLGGIGWSLTVYTPQGDNIDAIPGVAKGPTDVALMMVPPTEQMLNMLPGARRDALRLNQLTVPTREGLVVVRAPITGEAMIGALSRELQQTTACEPTSLGVPLR